MKKWIIVLLITLLTLSGCSLPSDPIVTDATIIHDLGTTEVMTNPKKVVVFDLGVLETLDALDIDVAAVPKSNITSNLQKFNDSMYVNAGTLFEPDFEALYTLSPDLIIISGRAATHYEELSKIAPTIFMGLNNEDFLGSFTKNMQTLATIFPDAQNKINEKLNDYQKAVNEALVMTKASTQTVMMLLVNGNSLSVFGQGGRFGFMFNELKLTTIQANIDASSHGMEISFEFIARENPDVIYVMDRGQIVGSETSAKQLLDNDIVNQSNAARNNRIVYVDPEAWYITIGGLNSNLKILEEVLSAFSN